MFLCVCVYNMAKENFDPNAVSHTTKSDLIKMIEDSNAEVLIYFCKFYGFVNAYCYNNLKRSVFQFSH